MNILEGTKIINYTANTVHSRTIAVGFGMVLVFNEKVEEATDFIAAGYPSDLTVWPFIQAETDALGITATQAADDIVTEKGNWIVVAALVENIRLKAIFDIKQKNADVESIVTASISAFDAI